jgi:hypothetical protein
MAAGNGKIQVADKFKHLDPHHTLSDSIRAGNFHSIRMKGKIWKLQTGGELYSYIQADGHPLPYLDVVIIGIHPGPGNSRVYYPGTYQEDSTNPPTCASLNGVIPDAGVPIPQNKTCNGCKHDQWKPNRGGKDCKEHKRIAIIPLPYMKTKPALKEPMKEPVFFKVPPASLKIWKAYTDDLQDRDAPYAAVITRIMFSPDKLFEISFKYLKSLTNADSELILPLLDSAATKNILGSMHEYKQIGAVPPMDTPQETGFAAAFGKQAAPIEATANVPAKRGPGRPKKQVEPEETVKAADEQESQESQESQEGGEAGSEDEASSFQEVQQDDELDNMMTEVLGKAGKPM